MTIKRKREWANSSSNVYPLPPADIDAGWPDGSQPPAPYENSEQRLKDRILNNLVDYGPDPLHHNVSETDVARGYLRQSWWDPSDPVNELAIDYAPTNKPIMDVGYYNDPATGKKYILSVADYTASTQSFIDMLDPKLLEVSTFRGSQVVRTSAVTSSLPSPVGYWKAQAACTDGTYIYITFEDSGSLTSWRIQAYTITLAGTSEWARRPGWPATGVPFTASVPGPSQTIDTRRCAMDMCGSIDRIAMGCGGLNITSSSVAAITVLNGSDGSIYGQGAGDAPTGAFQQFAGSLAADDELCVFGTYDESTLSGTLCSLIYSAPTTGVGGDIPLTNPIVDTLVSDVKWITYGQGVFTRSRWVASWTDTNVYKKTSPPNVAASTRSYLSFQQGSVYRGVTNNVRTDFDTSGKILGRMVFDGFRLWVTSIRDDNAGDGNLVVNTFNPSAFMWASSSPETTRLGLADLSASTHSFGSVTANPSLHLKGTLVFDGDTVWVSPNTEVSGVSTGRVYGVRRAAIRW